MESINPKLAQALPEIKADSIGIIGGAGRVTRSLLTRLHHTRPEQPVKIYVSSTKTKAKLEAFLVDLGMDNAEVTQDLKKVSGSELVVFCAGASTQSLKGVNTKEGLLTTNKQLAQDLLSPDMGCKAIIVVTNPTTNLVPFVQSITGKPAYGVGVENDNIRYRRSSGNDEGHFLVGAHNFFEMVEGRTTDTGKTPILFNQESYKKITEMQDVLLAADDMDGVIEHIHSLPPEHQWYAAQRVHSKFNDTTNSCAEAITNIASFLAGKAVTSVTLEAVFQFGDGIAACIGWPIDPKTRQPVEIGFTGEQVQQLEVIKKKYTIPVVPKNQPGPSGPFLGG